MTAQVAAGATADTRCLVEAFQDVKVSDIRRRCAHCGTVVLEVCESCLYYILYYMLYIVFCIDWTRATRSASVGCLNQFGSRSRPLTPESR